MEFKGEIEKLNYRRNYYDEWLHRYRTATEVLPYIQSQRDITDWQLKALSSRPDEANEISQLGLGATFERENDYLRNTLPMMPPYDSNRILTYGSFSASGSASVYEYVTRVGGLGTPSANQYASQFTHSYQELQVTHNRAKDVRELISKLGNPQTLDRFDRAETAVAAARLDVGQRTSTAFETRTLLDGIQGDLFNRARNWPEENMTWETMAARLATGGATGVEAIEVRSQKSKRSSLINRLSEIGKDREAGHISDIGNIWTQTLDHIYTVLGLINLTS